MIFVKNIMILLCVHCAVHSSYQVWLQLFSIEMRLDIVYDR